MERTDLSAFPMGNADNNEYNLVDFMDEANFEQFLALIRGESTDPNLTFCPDYLDCEHINGCSSVENCQFEQNSFDPFDPTIPTFSDPHLVDSLPNSHQEMKQALEENDAEEYSSETMTTTTTTTTKTPTKRSTNGDRSRTLISERRRRGRMKEKLYALRALVPNITKMDKASIVGDAAAYVQELQMQAKKLTSEIEALESSLLVEDNQQSGAYTNSNNSEVTSIQPTLRRTIKQIDVFRVEEKEYYVRVVSNRGQGVAVSLYRALESFSSFSVQSSNLATVDAHNFLLTFTLKVKERESSDTNLQNLKLWIAGAFLNQGFDFKTYPSI